MAYTVDEPITCLAVPEIPFVLLGIEMVPYYVLSQLNLVHVLLSPPFLTVFL
jgi:hypothetical protein